MASFLILFITIFFFSSPATGGVIFSNTGTYPDSNLVLVTDNNKPPTQNNTIGNPVPSLVFTTSTTGGSNGYKISNVISDFIFETDVMFTDVYACEGFYLGFRAVDSNNYYYLKFSGRYDGGFIIMGKNVGGTDSILAYITNQGWSANTWYRIKLVAQGSSLKAYVNDVLKIDVNDTSYTSGTTDFSLGFYMPSGTVSWYLDNMKLSTEDCNGQVNEGCGIKLPMIAYQCEDKFKVVPPFYDKTDNTICTSGCALADITMVLNYYLNKAGLPMVDMEGLNEWLNLKDGYVDKPETSYYDGLTNWGAINRYPNSSIFYDDVKSNERLDHDTKTAILNSELIEGHPVILRVRNPETGNKHFVVATGISGNTWNIVDPGRSDAKTTLAKRFNNIFYGIRLYRPRQ